MPLLDYTTSISPFRTIGELQETLVVHGRTPESRGCGLHMSLGRKRRNLSQGLRGSRAAAEAVPDLGQERAGAGQAGLSLAA